MEQSQNYKDLVAEMKKMEYMETLKAVFCFETGIEDEEYLSNMADYFINSKQIHNFLDEELFNKQLEYYQNF
ncbi:MULTISPECIES: hypothetical protein [Staphylococcus]|jgi:hypothetical protein|uniref:hypothetical protein n=1 Tax=Staphylococcus TaxID=1279 RepID=UPI0016429F19|nr:MULTISPECIES: hypothetical protein [Staphylococcus]MBC2921944.1 hypothetical protein [Staphylococcus saprophyticus]MBC2958533.1 hypothetical protein [Staphylococcus saprophyticus]MBC3010384.1 hypothetical protein [Staphylococcus saprophyticus]MBC3024263.1 hypothetical protein [Staphylococcus saprophyticus]MBC3031490.1 hypothetical protein [Staphylococcus saprophyticus]